MTELDFDELDKAVSDLMVNVDTSKRTDGLDDPVDTIVTIPPSDMTGSAELPTSLAMLQDSTVTDDAQTNRTASLNVPATPSLAIKRRGQFMDIVHPSLSMTNQSKFANQHGTTIKPSSSAESSAANNTNKAPQPAPDTHDETSSIENVSQPDWPDPIDTANGVTGPAEGTSAASTTGSNATTNESVQSESTEPAPLSSPFLSDTKVEKRPLGGLTPNLDVRPAVGSEKSEVDAKAPAPVTPTKVLPAEFGGDVMAVESKDLSSHPDATKVLSTPAQVAAVSASETKTLSSNGSISQQYTEQPSSGDQTNGSIYDTATYHQVLDADKPKKKSSPIKWIIWIIVLLLVGAAGGAAYFYFTR